MPLWIPLLTTITLERDNSSKYRVQAVKVLIGTLRTYGQVWNEHEDRADPRPIIYLLPQHTLNFLA